jgi:hypothetical protein
MAGAAAATTMHVTTCRAQAAGLMLLQGRCRCSQQQQQQCEVDTFSLVLMARHDDCSTNLAWMQWRWLCGEVVMTLAVEVVNRK